VQGAARAPGQAGSALINVSRWQPAIHDENWLFRLSGGTAIDRGVVALSSIVVVRASKGQRRRRDCSRRRCPHVP